MVDIYSIRFHKLTDLLIVIKRKTMKHAVSHSRFNQICTQRSWSNELRRYFNKY